MAEVFVDTAYWIASFLRADQWHQSALAAQSWLGDASLVTTHEVFAEFLTAVSNYGPQIRAEAASMVRRILSNQDVRVMEQSRDTFLAGLARYERRLDKGYSLQDCVSMNVMDAEGITGVLTSDHHFEQEGFTILTRLDQ